MKSMNVLISLCIIGALAIGVSSEVWASEGCHIGNYRDYIFSQTKTEELIEQTGRGCQLAGANLSGKDLAKANFKGANLIGANLFETNLEGANLIEAYLLRANLSSTNLKGANLIGAHISEKGFSEANIKEANLEETHRYNKKEELILIELMAGTERLRYENLQIARIALRTVESQKKLLLANLDLYLILIEEVEEELKLQSRG